MKGSLFLFGLLCISFAANLRTQPAALYENTGIVDFSNPPVVDALAFVNSGSFTISSTLPFDTLNTLHFTNRGSISGSIGFNFQHIAPSGTRSSALNFVNAPGAEIIVESSEFSSFSPFLLFSDSPSPSYLLIAASNVVNSGRLQVSASGLIQIEGDNVDLFNGGFEVEPIAGLGSIIGSTNFYPDTAIRDVYWGGITNLIADTSEVVLGTEPALLVQTPPHRVTNAFPLVYFEQLSLANPAAYAISNVFSDTNVVVQGIFALSPPGMDISARFSVSPLTNTLNTAMVELTTSLTNVVNGGLDTATLYLIDQLAWSTNHTQLQNVSDGTYRPAVYEVSRVPPFEWFFGNVPQDLEISSELFYGPTYSNTITTNLYAAYSAEVDNLITRPPLLIPGASVHEWPGRIEINAGNLDLRNARFRGEGIITINAEHLISSAGAVVDAENLSFNLASTNGMLDVRDVGRNTVERFNGTLQMFSMVWTNQNTVIEESDEPPPPPEPGEPEPPEPTPTLVTNMFNIFHHILVVDARGLRTQVPAYTHDFAANGTNVIIRDSMQIVRSFKSDARNLEIEGNLSLYGEIVNIGVTNFPNLRELTINGSLDVPVHVVFGFDAESSLERFVNRGALTAFNPKIAADYFENAGEITGGGNVEIRTQTAKLDGGNIVSGRDILLTGRDVKIRDAEIASGQRLVVDVSERLADSGPGSGNVLSLGGGLIMRTRPAAGDLLGTAVESTIPRFTRIDHMWAAEDRGAVAAGFENNAALGRLLLAVPRGSQARFSPAGSPSALYVDLLELRSALTNNWRDALVIDEGMTLYFAAANLPVEELDGTRLRGADGRPGGWLRWVRSYAGENSSVDILDGKTGQTIRVNRGLRDSLTIDSDGDGTANGVDPTPFDGVTLTDLDVDSSAGPTQVRISWMAAAQTVYRVEYRSGVRSGDWNLLRSVRNDENKRRRMTVTDEAAAGAESRFYRVTYQPQ